MQHSELGRPSLRAFGWLPIGATKPSHRRHKAARTSWWAWGLEGCGNTAGVLTRGRSLMTMWRSSLLAMAVAAGLAGGATLAAADGPSGGRAQFPNIPWTWTGLYVGLHAGSADAPWG